MKSLAGLSVKRPVTTIMVLMSVLVLGMISFAKLPLAFLPEVDFPAIFISVPYPNSSPEQIEKEIVKPLEETLATLSGVRKMSSNATADEASVQLDFNWGDSLDVVRMKVAEKIDEVRPELPADVATDLHQYFQHLADPRRRSAHLRTGHRSIPKLRPSRKTSRQSPATRPRSRQSRAQRRRAPRSPHQCEAP